MYQFLLNCKKYTDIITGINILFLWFSEFYWGNVAQETFQNSFRNRLNMLNLAMKRCKKMAGRIFKLSSGISGKTWEFYICHWGGHPATTIHPNRVWHPFQSRIHISDAKLSNHGRFLMHTSWIYKTPRRDKGDTPSQGWPRGRRAKWKCRSSSSGRRGGTSGHPLGWRASLWPIVNSVATSYRIGLYFFSLVTYTPMRRIDDHLVDISISSMELVLRTKAWPTKGGPPKWKCIITPRAAYYISVANSLKIESTIMYF